MVNRQHPAFYSQCSSSFLFQKPMPAPERNNISLPAVKSYI